MESSNINQTWKSQTVVSEIKTGVNLKNPTAADELTLLRNRQLKMQLRVLPLSLFNLGIAANSYYRYFTGQGSIVSIIAGSVLLCIMLVGYYQLYRLYKWRQAEIFADTRTYLNMSRNIITTYLKRSKQAQYVTFIILPVVIGTLYYTVDPLKFKIFTAVLLAIVVAMIARNKSINRSMHNTYDPIIGKIDTALNSLQSAQ